jgi:hypothetical protein
MEVTMNIENINKLIAYIPKREITGYGGPHEKITNWMSTSMCFDGICRQRFGESYDPILTSLGVDLNQRMALYGMADWDGEHPQEHDWDSFTELPRDQQDTILVSVLTVLRDTGKVFWPGVATCD